MQDVMLPTILSQIRKSEQLIEAAHQACLATNQHRKVLNESVQDLKGTIRKILSTTKTIDHHLAFTLAKTIVLVQSLEEAITGYKNIEFKGVLQQVLDIASKQLDTKLQSQTHKVDVVKEIQTILANLHGHAKKKVDVTEVVNKIVEKISKQYDRESVLDVMKLTSKIVQSNNEPTLRQQVIKMIT